MSILENHPAIVVAAFDRPLPLARLLDSINRSQIPNNTELVISIDNGNNPAINRLAENFQWLHGTKSIICHSRHLGLREHILRCGDLTERFGSIILLEDDLLVSPHFFQYSLQALSFYDAAENIAGVSLYSHHYNEYVHLPFDPLFDGHDNFFLQIASSWGQAWSAKQWSAFRNWYDQSSCIQEKLLLPPVVKAWPESSWKKYFNAYLVSENKFFVYPRISLTTNFCEPGTHNAIENTFQVPLSMGPYDFKFSTLEESIALYDSYCELLPEKLKLLAPELQHYDFEVDLYGLKELELVNSEFILTSKTHPLINEEDTQGLASFGLKMKPMELNISFSIPGVKLRLLRTKNIPTQIDFSIDRGAFFQYFYNEKRLIPDDLISQELRRIHGNKLVLEVINKVKNRVKNLFLRKPLN